MRPSLKKKPNIELIYRIYYNPETKVCIQKSIEEIPGLDSFVYVDKSTYDRVEFCSLFRINGDSKIERIPASGSRIALKLNDDGKFVTIKDNMLFVADPNTNLVDHWDFI